MIENDTSKPRREFPFIVIAKYGMAARNSALLFKMIEDLGCECIIECNGETAKGSSIMDILMLGMGCGARGKIVFSKPISPDDLLGRTALNDVIKFDF